MFSSPVFYVWLAWLLALAGFAVIRHRARQREELQREARRQQRETERGQRSDTRGRRTMPHPPRPTDYRDQLILVPVVTHSGSAAVAAGPIKPESDPDAIPDPATSM
jgi:heme exporter protein D